VKEKKRVRHERAAILTAASEGRLDEWSSVSDLREGQDLGYPNQGGAHVHRSRHGARHHHPADHPALTEQYRGGAAPPRRLLTA
jgi:hypothetical protein